jgi:hypothetical protein
MSNTQRVSEVYPTVLVPLPGPGEWIDFFTTTRKIKTSLYWRLNDGTQEYPDTVEFGFISAHRTVVDAEVKRLHLERSLRNGVAA